MILKKSALLAACAAALAVAAGPAYGQANPPPDSHPSCDDRPTCTPDNYGQEVLSRATEGLKRTIENPDAKGRVQEAKDTLDCVLKCIDEATRKTVDTQTKDPPP
jgi:hypothetical protein